MMQLSVYIEAVRFVLYDFCFSSVTKAGSDRISTASESAALFFFSPGGVRKEKQPVKQI